MLFFLNNDNLATFGGIHDVTTRYRVFGIDPDAFYLTADGSRPTGKHSSEPFFITTN